MSVPLEWNALQEVIKDARKRNFQPGQPLVRQGERGEYVMALIQGQVKVQRSTAEGRTRVLDFRTAGEVLGRSAVLYQCPRSAEILALTHSQVALVPANTYRSCLEQYSLTMAVSKDALDRVKETVAVRDHDCLRDRLAYALLLLAHRGSTAQESGRMALHISRSDLGSYLGASRNSISQEINRIPGVYARRRLITIDIRRLHDFAIQAKVHMTPRSTT
ncbi:Crp/Fnr family transcriptional regulator [Spirillospora sp. CA-294931]|uniref:Crp/Fnr family transcriptional regulator n=1 Tax=Spirillospora sp. CA-294931 TaxID=3240042 RepID=UPI003D913D01